MKSIDFRVERIVGMALDDRLFDIELKRIKAYDTLVENQTKLCACLEKSKRKNVLTETKIITVLRKRIERCIDRLGGPVDQSKRFGHKKKSIVEYPPGEKLEFVCHVWQPLTISNVELHRGIGPGELDWCMSVGGLKAKGGLFDVALPGGESVEVKFIASSIRGGQSARYQATLLRRAIERLIGDAYELHRVTKDVLQGDDLESLNNAVTRLNDVDMGLFYENLSDYGINEVYSALELLWYIDWDVLPNQPIDVPFLRKDPHEWLKWVVDVMDGSKCFKTDYIVLIRCNNDGNESLIVPRRDYSRCLSFVSVSKGDARFKYNYEQSLNAASEDVPNDLATD